MSCLKLISCYIYHICISPDIIKIPWFLYTIYFSIVPSISLLILFLYI